MAKVLVQFNETILRATSEANLDVRMASVDSNLDQLVYKKVDTTFLHFPSLEGLAADGAADIGLTSSSFVQTDVKSALEHLKGAAYELKRHSAQEAKPRFFAKSTQFFLLPSASYQNKKTSSHFNFLNSLNFLLSSILSSFFIGFLNS